jgi:hypothetical protein
MRAGSPHRFLCVFGALLLCACGAALAQKKNAASSPIAGVFSPDKGKFNIQLDGRVVGQEEFEIAPSAGGWAAHSITNIKPPDSTPAKISGMLTLQPDGVPIRYEWTSQAGKSNGAHIIFANGVAKITLEMEGARPCTPDEIKDPNRSMPCFFEQTLSFDTPLIAVLDDNLYYQYAVLARVYDWSKRGTQSLPVFIPQELTPGSISVESTGSATVGGKSYEGLRVSTSDLEVQLYLDANHRLMRLEVPSAKVSVIRE